MRKITGEEDEKLHQEVLRLLEISHTLQSTVNRIDEERKGLTTAIEINRSRIGELIALGRYGLEIGDVLVVSYDAPKGLIKESFTTTIKVTGFSCNSFLDPLYVKGMEIVLNHDFWFSPEHGGYSYIYVPKGQPEEKPVDVPAHGEDNSAKVHINIEEEK